MEDGGVDTTVIKTWMNLVKTTLFQKYVEP